LPDERIDWNDAIRRRFRREFGEWLPEDRVSQVLEAARLERTSGSAIDSGRDSSRSLELVFDDLKSIEEDYERAFMTASARRARAEATQWAASIPPPPRWAARARVVMKRYVQLQGSMLVMFGLADPIPREEVPSVLETAVGSDAQSGEVVTVQLPPGLGTDVVVGRLGIDMNPWLSAMRYSMKREESSDPTRFPSYDRWLAEHRAGLMQRLTRFGKLSFVIDHVVKETGCEPWEALTYLLCGEIPELPWVRVRCESRAAVGDTWVIEVAAPMVPARDVKQAYVAARDSSVSCGDRDHPHDPSGAQTELYEFVLPLREEGIPWAEIQRRWNARPGAKHYEKTKTMEVAYLRARRRIED
jgi:hypothetical protein